MRPKGVKVSLRMNFKRIRTPIILIFILFLTFIASHLIFKAVNHASYLKYLQAQWVGAKYLGDRDVIFQKKINDCGVTALKMIFEYYKIPSTSEKISKDVLREGNGLSMLSLKEMAELKGLKTECWRFALKDLKNIKLPAIAFVKGNHYVVISEIKKNGKIIILDPAIGKLSYSLQKFQNIWKGETLIFESSKEGGDN